MQDPTQKSGDTRSAPRRNSPVADIECSGRTYRNAVLIKGVWHFYDSAQNWLEPVPDQKAIRVLTDSLRRSAH